MFIVQVLPFQGRRPWNDSLWNSWGSVWAGLWAEPRDPERATYSSTCSCQLLGKSWEEKLLTWQIGEMHAEKIKVGWGWGARKNEKKELTRNCIFLPKCRNCFRCPGCVIFLLTGLVFVHVFIWSSKAKETSEWMQPCLLQCSHASPSYWISSAHQFDVELAETVVLSEAPQCIGKGSVYYRLWSGAKLNRVPIFYVTALFMF